MGLHAQKILTLETCEDAHTFCGTGSLVSLHAFDSKVYALADERGMITGGGPNISLPMSSLALALDVCFLILVFESL